MAAPSLFLTLFKGKLTKIKQFNHFVQNETWVISRLAGSFSGEIMGGRKICNDFTARKPFKA